MTQQYEITKAFHRKNLVVICCNSHNDLKKGKRDSIDIKINGIWLYNVKPNYTNIRDYKNYSHGFSPMFFKEKYGWLEQ